MPSVRGSLESQVEPEEEECYFCGLETQKLSLATHWDNLLCLFWMKNKRKNNFLDFIGY